MKFTISEDQEHLEVAEEDYEAYRRTVERGDVIAWERNGLVGLIYPDRQKDMLRVWDCYLDLKARGRIAEIPALIHSFVWADTEYQQQLAADDSSNYRLSAKAKAGPNGRSAGANP